MGLLFSFFTVVALIIVVFIGVSGANLHYVFGVVIPYIAFFLFLAGIAYRVLQWGKVPVPFRIPTTAGQQKSLPWIKSSSIENPFTSLGVIIRMALEVLAFRSLFRNSRAELRDGPKLSYASSKWLWMGALAFHYTFLIIIIRHLRLFFEPVPAVIKIVESLDGFFQVGAPVVYITDLVFLGAITFLFLRRVVIPKVRYVSLASDYFPLFLIGGIGITGVLMRYFLKTDVVGIKELTMGWVTFKPVVPQGINIIFYIHLFLVCSLLIYFPMSKLMHMAGVFLSPTRNLANNNRAVMHVNPWNYPVKVHTYEEYEDDFRDKMKAAGLPVEKE